jgi:hypothetical protein
MEIKVEKRIRSPNYPALSLPEAINKIAGVYRELHNHAAPREVVAKAMGYSGLSGASATAVSALHKYGLLDKAGADEIKVSDRAMRIMHPHSPEEKAAAIREAASEPALFAELAERFPGKIPNEDLLRNYLVRKGFAQAALGAVISAYRETSEMVQAVGGDYDSGHPLSHEEPDMHSLAVQSTPSQPRSQILVVPTDSDDESERQISRYDFEEGQYVRVVATKEIETEEALDMVETMIALKRKELERKKRMTVSAQIVDNSGRESDDV